MITVHILLSIVWCSVTVSALCFGGGGCGCGRRKREVDFYSEESFSPDPYCNSPQLKGVMQRNMAYSADESRLALSRTLESSGDKFLVLCGEEEETEGNGKVNRSWPQFATHYGMEFCNSKDHGHRCFAFALMNMIS